MPSSGKSPRQERLYVALVTMQACALMRKCLEHIQNDRVYRHGCQPNYLVYLSHLSGSCHEKKSWTLHYGKVRGTCKGQKEQTLNAA